MYSATSYAVATELFLETSPAAGTRRPGIVGRPTVICNAVSQLRNLKKSITSYFEYFVYRNV